MAYCMAMVFMFLNVFRMADIGNLNLSSSIFIDGVCVAALAVMFSIRGMYLLALASSVSGENMSLHYVNSMNCMIKFW